MSKLICACSFAKHIWKCYGGFVTFWEDGLVEESFAATFVVDKRSRIGIQILFAGCVGASSSVPNRITL